MFLFLNNDGLNNLDRRSPFLPYYTEIGPVVSDKKIFKIFYIDIEGKLASLFFDES